MVACTNATSAPFVEVVVGDSLAVTNPLASLSAEGTLNVPSESTVENLTTWPLIGVPAAFFTTAETITGDKLVTDVLDSVTETVGVPPAERLDATT